MGKMKDKFFTDTPAEMDAEEQYDEDTFVPPRKESKEKVVLDKDFLGEDYQVLIEFTYFPEIEPQPERIHLDSFCIKIMDDWYSIKVTDYNIQAELAEEIWDRQQDWY